MSDDFETRKAKIISRLTKAVRDLSELYAEDPERVVPEPDEIPWHLVEPMGDTTKITDAFPVTSQHSYWDEARGVYEWGPVVFCVFGVSKGGLPLH